MNPLFILRGLSQAVGDGWGRRILRRAFQSISDGDNTPPLTGPSTVNSWLQDAVDVRIEYAGGIPLIRPQTEAAHKWLASLAGTGSYHEHALVLSEPEAARIIRTLAEAGFKVVVVN